MVAANSREAYTRLLPELSRKEQEVYDIIERYGPLTNKQIGRLLSLDTCSITGRTNTLVEKDMVYEHSKGPCPITGYTASFWVATKETLF